MPRTRLRRWCALAVFACLMGFRFVEAEVRLALVITNQSYPGFGDLHEAHEDGDNIAKALSESGFEVAQFRDLNREDMLRGFEAYRDRLEKEPTHSVGFLYFSGHGVSESKRGDNWLIPANARIEGPDDLKIEGVRLGEWLDELEEVQSAIKLVVIDACRNVAFPGTRGAVSFRSVPQRDGMMIVFSTAPGEFALDTNTFSTSLAEGIRMPNVPAHEMLRQVRRRVLAETGDRQVPWVQDGTEEDFYFLGTASRALSADDVKALQQLLADLEGKPLGETGELDEGTRKALRVFHQHFDLSFPGVPTTETLNYVRIAQLSRGQSGPFVTGTAGPVPESRPVLPGGQPETQVDSATLQKIRSLTADLGSDDTSKRRGSREELAAVGPDVVAPLAGFLRKLNTSDPLYYRNRLGAVVALTLMLRDNKPRRSEILFQLEQQDIDGLVQASADNDRTLRIYASEFLYDLGDPRATEPAVRIFPTVSDDGRYSLALVIKGAAPYVPGEDRDGFRDALKALLARSPPKTRTLLEQAKQLSTPGR